MIKITMNKLQLKQIIKEVMVEDINDYNINSENLKYSHITVPDKNGTCTVVFKTKDGREVYPLSYSKKYFGHSSYEIAKFCQKLMHDAIK
jgi:hypothetical protein